MNSFVKIVASLLVVLFFFGLVLCSQSFASDINMNLTNPPQDDTNTIDTNHQADSNTTTNTDGNDLTTTVGSTNQNTEEGLSISSILTILLIAIGVVLIFLGIAVLIRLRN